MTEASPSKVDVAESSAAIAATTTTEPTNTTNTNTTIDAPMNDDVSASPQRPAEAESRVSFAAELGAVASNWRSVRAEFGLSEQDIFRRSERKRVTRTQESDGDDGEGEVNIDGDDDDDDGDDGDDSDDSDAVAPRRRQRKVRRTVKRNRQVHSYDGESDSGDDNHRDDDSNDDDDDDNNDDGDDGDDDDDAIDPRRNRAFEKRRAFDYEGRRGGSHVNYAEVDSDDDMSDNDRAVYEASKLKAEQALSIDTLGLAPAVQKIEQVLDHRIGDTGEVEYLIKWSGWSHVHNTWNTEAALSEFGGERILQNYIKKSQHDQAARAHMLAEDLEALDIERQMQLDQLEEFKEVERVIEQSEGDEELSFLCKWRHLPYDEATWELAADILPAAQAQIDSFLQRQQQSLTMRVYKPGTDRPQTFEPYEKQPQWLGSGDLKLRDYQLDGMNWLARNWTLDVNCILADEMGLGKTAQTISMLGHMRYAANVSGPFLVVVPLSTISNWQREFDMWLPSFNVIMYIGNARAREIIRAKELWQPRGRKSFVHKFNVLLTTYEMLLKDARHLKVVDWAYIAVDEAHRLKNTESQLYQCLVEFHSANRLLITGTPLQNSLGELWSLLHYLDRRKFATLDDFVTRYGTLSTQAEIAKLHAELRPHLLRRLKKDVEKSLPSKIERILRVDLSPMQKQIYRWVLGRNYNELNRNARGGSKMSLLNVLVDLKKTCNHPVLVPIGESELRQKTALLGLQSRGVDIDADTLVRASGKLELLDRLLVRLREGGHRVLIFSQMVLMLDVLGDYLKLRGYSYQRLDGSCSRRQRQTAMQQFNAPDSRDFCFLLSTRAGGLGINLATADTVVIFDSDWNPQNDLQAEARAHRIGQTKTVNIYRLVCKDTVEENILERAKQKMVLDHLVIQSMDTSGKKRESGVASKTRNPFKTNELSAIIKFGAQNLFAKPTTDDANADTAGGEAATNAEAPLPATIDLDEILSRAEVETGTEEPSMAEGLFAAFKVADFSAITRDDTASAAAAAAEQRRKAAAAHEAALAAVQKREVEDKELADDSGFWARLIPESERFVEVPEEKDDAAASAFGIVPARKAARAVQNLNENRLAQSRSSTTHGNASATAEKAAAAAAAAEKAMSREDRVARETLNARDVRVLLRGIMRFGWHDDENPPRFDDIVVQGKLQNKDRQTVLQAGSAVVRKARKVVADPPSAPPADEANASTAAAGDAAAKKTPKFDPMRFDFRGESVNAQQLVARIDGLTELRKRLVALGDNARSFRLPVTVKAPPNGWEVGWSPVDDAMLLIGVFKYGVGAWQQIRDEPQLRLTAKIQQNASAAAGDAGADGKEAAETAADPSKPGAAASHLSRRVDTLLRELCRAAGVTSNGASTSTPTAAATSSGASKAPPKRKAPPPGGSAAGAGGGAGGGAKSDAPKSKSAKTASKKSASGAATLVGEPIVSLTENEVENELYERARGYMATVKDTLKRMSVLPSRGDLNADEKRSRTRQYMLEVGAHIESVVEEKRTGGAFSVARLQLLRRHMWFYAASFTTTDSAQFEAAYRMLQVVAQKQQQQQQQQQH